MVHTATVHSPQRQLKSNTRAHARARNLSLHLPKVKITYSVTLPKLEAARLAVPCCFGRARVWQLKLRGLSPSRGAAPALQRLTTPSCGLQK